MKSYPISIARQSYRGSDARKRTKVSDANRIAGRIEDYLNQDLATKPDDTIQVYISHSIAREIGEDEEAVRRIIFATDCGSNGITIVKGDFERAMKARQIPPSSGV